MKNSQVNIALNFDASDMGSNRVIANFQANDPGSNPVGTRVLLTGEHRYHMVESSSGNLSPQCILI